MQDIFVICKINEATKRLVVRALALSDNFKIDIDRSMSMSSAIFNIINQTAPQGAITDEFDIKDLILACRELEEGSILTYFREDKNNPKKVTSVTINNSIVEKHLKD